MEDLVGKWSEAKLELLRKYLTGYVKVLRNQASKGIKGYEYIDGFAGTRSEWAEGNRTAVSCSHGAADEY